jgi:predicted nucleic acid-binding protein
MPVEALIDTNVLVYSVSSHPSEKEKRDRARALVKAVDFGTSAQILGEFYVTVTQKIAEPLSEREAIQFIAQLIDLPVIPIDSDLVQAAIVLRQEHQVSYWDGAIIAAAHRLGARTIYSEDLSHNHLYGSVRVINPFRGRRLPQPN